MARVLGGLQMPVTQAVPENEKRILSGIEQASGDGADFLLTPEGSLSGYHSGFDRKEVAEAAARLAEAARDAGVGLALGTCYKEIEDGKERCYNQVRVYSPEGDSQVQFALTSGGRPLGQAMSLRATRTLAHRGPA